MAELESRPGNDPGAGASATRRQFLTWLSRAFLGLWAIGGAGVVTSYLGAPDKDEADGRQVRIGRLDELRIGGSKLHQRPGLFAFDCTNPSCLPPGPHLEPSPLAHSLPSKPHVNQPALDLRKRVFHIAMNPIVVKVAIAIQARLIEPQSQIVRREPSGPFG